MHACALYRSYYSPSIIVSGQIHVLHNTIPLKRHAKILSTAIAQLLMMSKSTSSPERPTMYNLIVYKKILSFFKGGVRISQHTIDRIAAYSPMEHVASLMTIITRDLPPFQAKSSFPISVESVYRE